MSAATYPSASRATGTPGAGGRRLTFVPDESLENQLQRSLRPVAPRTEFVGHLQERLTTPVTTTLESRRSTGFGLLLVAFSLLSGVTLVWILRQLRAA